MVPTKEIRTWLLAAYDEGLAENGEYVLIYMNQQLPSEGFVKDTLTSESLWKGDDGRDEDVKTMMKSMLMVGYALHCS